MMAAASATAAFRSLALAADDAAPASARPDILARLSFDDARFFVGSKFTVHAHSGIHNFVCVKVKAIDPASTAPNRAFSMRFRPQPAISLKQGTYTFEHQVLGQFRLFIVPSGPDAPHQHYTAIINHATS